MNRISNRGAHAAKEALQFLADANNRRQTQSVKRKVLKAVCVVACRGRKRFLNDQNVM